MSMKNIFYAAACIAALSCAGCGSSDTAPAACDAARMRRTIEVLASDSLEGRRAASGNDLRAARYLAEELRKAGCEPLWEEMEVPFGMGDAADRRGMRSVLDGQWSDSSCNVVAVIRSGRPDADKILLGAHYDHMGRFKRDKGTTKAGEVLYGANDNASGTAAVTEIARLLAPRAAEFRHDLIIALFGAEEMGIIGSRHLERMLRDSSITVGHMVNLEMLGRMRGDTLMLSSCATCRLGEAAERVPHTDSLTVCVADRYSMGSDHAAFAQRMIPVSFFVTTDCSTLHRATDTAESLDMRGMEKAVNYIAQYVRLLLTDEQLPQLKGPEPTLKR